jgi:steroid delta-isomerase-like uncharacterized protein
MSIALGGVFQSATADTEANKAISRRDFEEALNQGKLEVYDEIIAPEAILHTVSGDIIGLEAIKGFASMIITAFPDINFTIEDMVAEEDLVGIRWTNTGTQQGEYVGMPATGIATAGTGMAIHRITDGKIQELWLSANDLGMLEQLGVMPTTHETYTWGEPSTVTGEPGDPETNKAIFQRMIDEVFKGNLAVIDEVFDADYVKHDPASPIEVRGPEGFKQWLGTMSEPYFSQGNITVEDMIGEGDKVAVRWTWSGTHTGEFMGIPPTGRHIGVRGTCIHRFADGKFVESWSSYDVLGMIQQLTIPEWPLEGVWITTVPTPLGNMIIKGTWVAQDAEKTRFTGEFEQINSYPLLIDVYPDAEELKLAGGLARKIGVNQYEMTALEYFTKTTGLSQEEVVGIGVETGTFALTGPDQAQGQAMRACYLAAQDADQDGFPDEGQEPVVILPCIWTGKRLTAILGYVPTP